MAGRNDSLLKLELEFQAAGQLLESVAERLLRLERLDPTGVDEDVFADAKNDALALAPMYRELRHQALVAFGTKVLDFSPAIRELDELYGW